MSSGVELGMLSSHVQSLEASMHAKPRRVTGFETTQADMPVCGAASTPTQ